MSLAGNAPRAALRRQLPRGIDRPCELRGPALLGQGAGALGSRPARGRPRATPDAVQLGGISGSQALGCTPADGRDRVRRLRVPGRSGRRRAGAGLGRRCAGHVCPRHDDLVPRDLDVRGGTGGDTRVRRVPARLGPPAVPRRPCGRRRDPRRLRVVDRRGDPRALRHVERGSGRRPLSARAGAGRRPARILRLGCIRLAVSPLLPVRHSSSSRAASIRGSSESGCRRGTARALLSSETAASW